MGRLLAMIALVTFAGCECPGNGVCMSLMTAPDSLAFTLAGAPAQTRLVLPVSCGDRAPDSVDISVLDPLNEPIGFDAGAVVTGIDGFSTTVTFTPSSPGPYHLAARFQPNFGTAQVDVLAAKDRHADPPVLTVLTSDLAGCDRVDVTLGKKVFCQHTQSAVVAGGTVFLGPTDYSGDAVWAVIDGELSRWVEADAGVFVKTHSSTGLALSPSTVLLAHSDDVIAEDNMQLRFNQVEADGGLSNLYLPQLSFGTSAWRDDAVAGLTSGGAFCVAKLDGGSAAFECPMGGAGATQTPFAEDRRGVWESAMNASSQTVVTLVNPSGSLSITLPSDWAVPPALAAWEHGGSLVSGSRSFVLTADDFQIQLEQFAGPGEVLGQVNSRFVVINGDGGMSRIVAR